MSESIKVMKVNCAECGHQVNIIRDRLTHNHYGKYMVQPCSTCMRNELTRQYELLNGKPLSKHTVVCKDMVDYYIGEFLEGTMEQKGVITQIVATDPVVLAHVMTCLHSDIHRKEFTAIMKGAIR